MSLLDFLSEGSAWEKFYTYKTGLVCARDYSEWLRNFIDERKYLPVSAAIESGAAFPLPKKAAISKLGKAKKRIVYTYPENENTVLKLLTWLMLRQYDALFAPNLYSFRPGRTAKDAVRYMIRSGKASSSWYYKVDISDYFNSIPVERMLPKLKEVLAEDVRLYEFLARLLSEENVIEHGTVHPETKGIMAGTPISSFLANLFLSDLDHAFQEEGKLYLRYSDDILVLGDTEADAKESAEKIRGYLSANGLRINPEKESFGAPEEGISFLGFYILGETVDIAPATVTKLKNKMRRKRDALARWKARKNVDGSRAAKAFIRIFNRKLLEDSEDHELTWSRWFFPTITTTRSLHEIDLYAQDCLRFLIGGKHTKARYNVRYEDLKELGYLSLVHEYYRHKAAE